MASDHEASYCSTNYEGRYNLKQPLKEKNQGLLLKKLFLLILQLNLEVESSMFCKNALLQKIYTL